MKVVFCIPTVTRPYQVTLDALEKSVPLLDEAGLDHSLVQEIANPYISAARATMLRKALDAKADTIVFIDHDVSWKPKDLLELILADADVAGGTYRFKQDGEHAYMGRPFTDGSGLPRTAKVDKHGVFMLHAACLPAGFLKVTAEAVDKFMTGYPALCYGPKYHLSVDLFNHGAHGGLWFGEDYAFCRNWNDIGGECWLLPNLDIAHHSADRAYPGNYHEFLMRQPGGVNDPNKVAA